MTDFKNDDFKYFKLSDFDCQETGENNMSFDFIHALDQLRGACGFPFIVTSGFRSKNHSIEKRKEKLQEPMHTALPLTLKSLEAHSV